MKELYVFQINNYGELSSKSNLSKAILRKIIKNKFSLENPIIKKNDYGKPYIENINNFNYNISHSKNILAIALDDNPIGIDVEYMKLRNYIEIAQEFFTESEVNWLASNKNDIKTQFYRLWTLKESYIKAIGFSSFKGFKKISITIENNHVYLTSSILNKMMYFKEYHELRGYKLSLCSYNNIFPDKVIIKNIAEFLA